MTKTISTVNLRNHLGEILEEIRFTRVSFVVLKNNDPVVKISPLQGSNKKKGFDINEYRRLNSKLPPKYQVGDPDPDLLEIFGSGDYVPLEEEKQVIYEYLDEKYG